MTGKSPLWRLFVVFLMTTGYAVPAEVFGQSAAQLLSENRPRMDNVFCTMPTAQELAQCKVEPVRNAQNKQIGLKVVDGHGQTIRCFLDTTGSGRMNVWQYFKDGAEVYREIDSKGTGRPDQYRWLNEGGMKWGLDYNGDGKIDAWRSISAEEVGQEVFQAVATRDFDRLQALFISEKDMRDIRLSEREVARIKGQIAKAQAKFRATCNSVPQGAKFRNVDGATPSCVPGDSLGMDTDLIRFPSRTIYYEAGSTAKFLQTGEMIQVGSNWRLVDAPGDEIAPPTPPIEKFLKVIADLDTQTFPHGSPQEVKRLSDRAATIEQMLAIMDGQDPQRAMWYKQLLDNLAAAASAEHVPSLTRLGAFRAQLEKSMPGSEMAAYAAYREICAIFLVKMSKEPDPKKLEGLQNQWHDALMKFVQTYPKAEDTPDAIRYLAVGAEFSGRDAQAKAWYEQIYKNFPNHALAEVARGSVRRLECVGQPMELSGPRLDGGSYSVTQAKGKVVAVYYWASYCGQCKEEFEILRKLHSAWASKGFELVCINLDDSVAECKGFLAQQASAGIHMFQQGKTSQGLSSPLATHYGINGLPTMFLIDKQGRVINTRLQARDLEDALRRAL